MTNSIETNFSDDVQEIKEWWKEDKQKHLTRPYTAESVASYRNNIKISYPSSTQAIKLWKLLHKHREEQTPIMTVGCIEPLIASQMSKAGLECVYASGGVSGLTQVEEPGVDHADYPWDTMPKVVARVFKSQLWNDRRQRQFLLSLPEEERKTHPRFDFLLPIIADGDMGFGGATTIMKLTKSFVEAGVAMFHLDDLAIGVKKFTQGIGRTVIPTSEYLKRLTAARLQIDIMGAETLLMSRIDSYHGGFITSVFDSRDHAYVMGSTNPDVKPLIVVLNEARESNGDVASAKLQWFKDAKVMTFDEAFKEVASEDEYNSYCALLKENKLVSLTARRKFAAIAAPEKTVYFDWDAGRNSYGHYLFKQCIESVIDRAIAALPLTDTTWGRVDTPIWEDIVKFHTTMKEVSPERIFGFGYTGTFDYPKNGYSTEDVKTLHHSLAKIGAVWQVQPIFAIQGVNLFTGNFGKVWKEEGISGYIREIQNKALDTTPYPPKTFGVAWGGGYLADGFLDICDSCDSTIPT